MDITTRAKLLYQCKLIFYGLPIGKNAPHDTPIIGNKSLAQVIVNRVESISKKPEEFKYMIGAIMSLIKETEGKEVHKIKMNHNTDSLVRAGLTDQHGFLIKKQGKSLKMLFDDSAKEEGRENSRPLN